MTPLYLKEDEISENLQKMGCGIFNKNGICKLGDSVLKNGAFRFAGKLVFYFYACGETYYL